MVLKTEKFIISEMTVDDINGILEVYNSNQNFLLSHINKKSISIDWLIEEQQEMKEANFKTLVVKEDNSIIGFIDVCIEEESYLSLMIIHNEYRGRGYGKEIYHALEQYLEKMNSKRIRIDVVYNYNEKVLQFWGNRGFKETEKIKLQWTDITLDAIVMKKEL